MASDSPVAAPDAGAGPAPTVDVPSSIESPRAKLCYLALRTTDANTVDDLVTVLREPKLSLFTVLATLVALDVVETDGDRYWVPDRSVSPAPDSAEC